MTEEPKSTDYHSVTPYLLVPGVSDLAAFVAEAYGAPAQPQRWLNNAHRDQNR